ncbi:hypothetical protein FRC02_001527 [Tulasnella sp. 418]|nr:hypothetical protein FRC02_001527 [Tulasnella sp. 418]
MSKQQEAQQLLDDLDSFAVPPPKSSKPPIAKNKPPAAPGAPAVSGNDKEVLAFIDEITQKSSEPRKSTSSLHASSPAPITRVTLGGSSPRPGTPGLGRKSVDSARNSPKPEAAVPSTTTSPTSEDPAQGGGGGWGWGSVWGTASAALQQARAKVDEQVKNLPQIPQNDPRKWKDGMMEYVKQAHLDKIGEVLYTTHQTQGLMVLSDLGQEIASKSLSTLTDIMNVVAPPISEHEVIQVWLSHDMEGYEGVESLVYRALARILEQVEGGELVVNKGNESRKKEQESSSTRKLNAVSGLEAATKLAEVEVDELIKLRVVAPPPATSSMTNPTTYSPVYLRIQPFITSLPTISSAKSETGETSSSSRETLQFLLHMEDPEHQLVHTQVTQSISTTWLDLWDEDENGEANDKKNGEWIEDFLVEVIRVGVEIIGQEYVVCRMGWDKSDDKGKEKEKSSEDD